MFGGGCSPLGVSDEGELSLSTSVSWVLAEGVGGEFTARLEDGEAELKEVVEEGLVIVVVVIGCVEFSH